MKIYLVVNRENSPGRVIALYRHKSDAEEHAAIYDDQIDGCEVIERTLHFGQAPNLEYSE